MSETQRKTMQNEIRSVPLQAIPFQFTAGTPVEQPAIQSAIQEPMQSAIQVSIQAPMQDTQEEDYDDDEPAPPPPKLTHSLSHVDTCFSKAMEYKDVCKEGEIVLMNYYVSVNNWTTISYLQKVDGQMIQHEISGLKKKDIPVFWQHDSCAFKWGEDIFGRQ